MTDTIRHQLAEGDRALIHLHVPAVLKARWVRESRAVGMRLTDWIVSRVESKGQSMKIFNITDALAGQYQGAGWALAAIAGQQVVALRYVSDVAPAAVVDSMTDGGEHAASAVRRWLSTSAAAPIVRELQALGQVSVGMCGNREFCEL